MLKRAFSFSIIVAVLGGTVGASAHDESWAAASMPLCCKTARSNDGAARVSMARLCCKLNCSEPGSGGSTSGSNLSRNQNTNSATALILTPSQFSTFSIRDRAAQTNHPHNSNPKYIQHLALLI
jgi:hypothetical protein